MWNTRTWFSSACRACFHTWPGASSDTSCTWSRRNCVSTRVAFSDKPVLRSSVEASSGLESLELEDVSSSEG